MLHCNKKIYRNWKYRWWVLLKFKNKQKAIDLANDSTFGLGCCVSKKDIERGKRVANQIRTRMFSINHPTWTPAYLLFGGNKGCSYGRELCEVGMDEFVNKKLIRVSEINDPFLFGH